MRTEIFLTKITVAFLNIFILNVLAAVISYIAIQIYKNGPFNVEPFLVLTLYTFLLNLLFGAIGLFISVIIKRARPVTSFCVGLVLVFYFINTISKMSGVEGSFGYLSPFKWVDVDVLSPAYGFDLPRTATFILVTALFVVISGFIYRRKDILI
jgi:ABC-2 type transport system permease protein